MPGINIKKLTFLLMFIKTSVLLFLLSPYGLILTLFMRYLGIANSLVQH